MKNNKIDEIGKKLDVNTSVIIEERFEKIKKKNQYMMANTLTFILSCILGSFFGFLENREITGYPYLNNHNIIGLFGTSSINFLNGSFTLSQRFNSILSKRERFSKFILNAFLSIIAYLIIFGIVAYNKGTPTGIMYNVYDSSKKNQKK